MYVCVLVCVDNGRLDESCVSIKNLGSLQKSINTCN